MVINCESHKFDVPKRSVLSPPDIQKWEHSSAYQDILGFLTSMNTAVKAKKLSAECVVSPVTADLLNMLDTISQWVDIIPPVDQSQRYGNKAFREFFARLQEEGEEVVKEALPAEFHAAVPEMTVYLVESVGNSTRIDYGTGHELAFIMFLTCIFKIGALKKEDSVAAVTKIFHRYLGLCRQLQMTYKMEPAGSQGVWSLDDYQFVPFIWGSSQLQMSPKITPDMFCQEDVVDKYADEYLFLSCIKFILSVKTGPFAEHSNQLWNISGVQSWSKINQGLIKMYKAEVLHKFPVVQHVLFGSILSFSGASEVVYHPPGTDLPHTRLPGASLTIPKAGLGPPLARPVPSSVQAGSTMLSKAPCPSTLPGTFPSPPSSLSSTTLPSCKIPQGLTTVDKGAHDFQSHGIDRTMGIPCTEERHPAMSPLNPLMPCNFRKPNGCKENSDIN